MPDQRNPDPPISDRGAVWIQIKGIRMSPNTELRYIAPRSNVAVPCHSICHGPKVGSVMRSLRSRSTFVRAAVDPVPSVVKHRFRSPVKRDSS